MISEREIKKLFSADDLERIRESVDAAEGRTAGEIVPYVVGASDVYESAAWKGATLGALLAALIAAGVQTVGEFWDLAPLLWIALPALLGAGLGFLAVALIPALRRALVSSEVMERRVRRRASVAFLDEEVFKTRERTGILLFVSLFERRVVVLGDEGINRRVEPGEWEGIVAGIVAGIRGARPADSMIEAIGRCGELLERKGVEIRPDDEDELADGLRTRES